MQQPNQPIPAASFESIVATAMLYYSSIPDPGLAESLTLDMCQFQQVPMRLVLRAACALSGVDISLPTDANILTPSLN